MEIELEIVTLVILIALSGFFSGLEVALVGVRRSKVQQMLNQKLPGSTSLHKLKSNPSRMMASVNLGNNLVNVASTALATDIALKIFDNGGLAITIAKPLFSNIFNAILVANAVDATLTKLFPRLTLAIILLGLDFSLWSAVAPGNFWLSIWWTFERLTPTNATSRPLKNPDKPIKIINALISYVTSILVITNSNDEDLSHWF